MNFTKEIKSLKQIIGSLQMKQDNLEDKVKNREGVFEEKSEKWQESQKGLDHQELTEVLDNQCSELAEIISDMEEYLSTLESFNIFSAG